MCRQVGWGRATCLLSIDSQLGCPGDCFLGLCPISACELCSARIQSCLQAYDEWSRAGSSSKGTYVLIPGIRLPAPHPCHSFPIFQMGEALCSQWACGGGKGSLAVSAKGQVLLLHLGSLGALVRLCQGQARGWGLSRQRLGLCSLLLPLAGAGEARGCWPGGWALHRPSKCLAVPVCPGTGWGVGTALPPEPAPQMEDPGALHPVQPQARWPL